MSGQPSWVPTDIARRAVNPADRAKADSVAEVTSNINPNNVRIILLLFIAVPLYLTISSIEDFNRIPVGFRTAFDNSPEDYN